MTLQRKLSREEILKAISKEAGKLFDPLVDDAMIAYNDALESGRENAREIILSSVPPFQIF